MHRRPPTLWHGFSDINGASRRASMGDTLRNNNRKRVHQHKSPFSPMETRTWPLTLKFSCVLVCWLKKFADTARVCCLISEKQTSSV